MDTSNTEGVSYAPPSDASDGPTSLQTSLSSVQREVARPTPGARRIRLILQKFVVVLVNVRD